jgi:hypothetical protein
MIDIVNKWFDMAVSIFIYVMCTGLTVTLMVVAQEPIINSNSDKTFMESTGVQEKQENELYGNDILFMLLNSDEMTPYPKAIKINDSPVIKLDNNFIATKMNNISVIYSESGEYKLKKMMNWKIIDKKFVYSGTDAPYIQYILKEVP